MAERKRDRVMNGLVACLMVGALIVIIVSIIAFIIAAIGKDGFSCERVGLRPNNSNIPRRIKSYDDKVLAQFSAYLRYQNSTDKSKGTYLPLNWKSIKEKLDDEVPVKYIIFKAHCATVTFHLRTTREKRQIVVSIQVDVKLVTEAYQRCYIDDPHLTPVEENRHYKCPIQFELSCYFVSDKFNTKVYALALGFDYLEYQVDGDPEKVKWLEYSNPHSGWC